MRIGIVGAGLAGLACADGLVSRGHDVMLFDKGRGAGGRMSTRRIDTPSGTAHFDHGAQYFTVRDTRFSDQVNTWVARGVVAPWPAAGAGAHVGVPAMNSPVRDLAARHNVQWSVRVTEVGYRNPGWRLVLDNGEFRDVDLTVIAIPAEQAAALLDGDAPALAAQAHAAVSDPCWTVMVAFAEPVASPTDCLTGQDVLGWAARNSAKPGRTGPESWVLQATPQWSRRHIDAGRDEVTAELIAALSAESGAALPAAIGGSAHLWRFARSAQGGRGPVLDPDRRIGVCGDWLLGPRVECAWLSGADLAERIGVTFP